MNRFVVLTLAVVAYIVPVATALPPRSPAQTLQSASDVLADFSTLPFKSIPPAILANAQGVAIVPRVIKAGLLIGGRGGHGVVLTRDRSGAWSGPTFVDLGGASFGFQAGVQSADVILVFKSRDSLNRILAGKGKLTLGADVAVAAGPVGRQAEAGTDARLQAEIVSYSRSRGLFAGIALDGAAILYSRPANAEYARTARQPAMTQLVTGLLAQLTAMSAPSAPPAVFVPPPAVDPLVTSPQSAVPLPPISAPGRP